MMTVGNVPIISLNLTEEEFQVLIFSVVSFNTMAQTAPSAAGMSSRSDRMKARRAAQRFNDRIVSLAKSYGMTVPK